VLAAVRLRHQHAHVAADQLPGGEPEQRSTAGLTDSMRPLSLIVTIPSTAVSKMAAGALAVAQRLLGPPVLRDVERDAADPPRLAVRPEIGNLLTIEWWSTPSSCSRTSTTCTPAARSPRGGRSP